MEYYNKQDIELFYDCVTPDRVYYRNEKDKFVEEKCENKEDFVKKVIHLNGDKNLFSPFRKLQGERKTESVIFLDKFVIDIDSDIDGEKSKVFEEFCLKNSIFLSAKIFSGGGYHYYIPYSATEIFTDEKRQQMINISNNFKELLIQSNVKMDKAIFDLSRLIRIWGTWNPKRQAICKVVYYYRPSDEQVIKNTEFINSIVIEKKTKIDIFEKGFLNCALMTYIKNNKLEKQNTNKNNVLIKNLAIYLKQNYPAVGYDIGVEITEKQGHIEAEFKGWWEKSGKELKEVSCGELVNWLKEHYPEIIADTCKHCKFNNANKITYTDDISSWNELKIKSRGDRKLYIGKEMHIKAMVLPFKEEHRQEFEIITRYAEEKKGKGDKQELTLEDLEEHTVFFDEKKKYAKSLKFREIGNVRVDMFVYKATEENTEYLLFSEHKIEFGENHIYGSCVKLDDEFLYGNYGKMAMKKKVLLVHSASPLKPKFNNAVELLKAFPYSQEEFLKFLFTESKTETVSYWYKQPEYFNDLILTFLFSGNIEYNLHLIICGSMSCGKTSTINCIYQKFDEVSPIVSMDSSTIKSLTPSFSGKEAKIGAFLLSVRICAVDELFSKFKGNEEGQETEISALNTLLEGGYNKISSSAKGSVKLQNKVKMFSVTNPIIYKNLEETLRVVPQQTMSRFLIYKLGTDFENYVRSKFGKFDGIGKKIDKNLFLGVYDYVTGFRSLFDEREVTRICNENLSICPEFMQNYYRARFINHHAICLMDGVVKVRCLFQKDEKFQAKPEDYTKFTNILVNIIQSWGDADDLSVQEKEFVDIIKNVTYYYQKVENKCKEKGLDFIAVKDKLLNKRYIKVKDGVISLEKEELKLNQL